MIGLTSKEPGTTRAPAFRALGDRLREDYVANGSSFSRPGFRAMIVHRIGAYGLTVRNRFGRAAVGHVHRVAHHFVRNHYGIEIHATTRIGRRCFIAHQHGIVLHPDARIGDDCKLRQGVTIGQLSGRTEREGAPVIGDRVEIGVGAVIVGPISIGDDVIVGPNAVVLRDVPAGAVVTGQPAKALLTGQP